MLLYSFNNQYPKPLPFRIRLSDGSTRTDPRTFTENDIADAGYVLVDNPPEITEDQVLEWLENGWFVREKTFDEKKQESDVLKSTLNVYRDERIANGFLFNGKYYDSGSEDQKRISGAAQLAFMAILTGAQPGDLYWSNPQQPFGWIAQDNDIVLMDAHTVIDFAKSAARWEKNHIFAARMLKDMELLPKNYKDDSYWPDRNIQP